MALSKASEHVQFAAVSSDGSAPSLAFSAMLSILNYTTSRLRMAVFFSKSVTSTSHSTVWLRIVLKVINRVLLLLQLLLTQLANVGLARINQYMRICPACTIHLHGMRVDETDVCRLMHAGIISGFCFL